MKRMVILLSLLLWTTGGAAAQTAEEGLELPRYRTGNMKYFHMCLTEELGKAVDDVACEADEIPERVTVRFTIDTAGRLTDVIYPDRTGERRTYADQEPVSQAARALVDAALERMDGWTPARRDGRPVPYRTGVVLRMPSEKIRMKGIEPLRFKGGDPERTFYDYMRVRVRIQNFLEAGLTGLVKIRFWVEPDGKLTIGEVVESPDKRMTREVIRAIRTSEGKWTPARKEGNPIRQEFVFSTIYSGWID